MKMRKWCVFLLALCLVAVGCAQEKPVAPRVKSYNSAIGLTVNRVTSMYVGYHIGPGPEMWEFTTKDPAQIKTVLAFLQKQTYRTVEKRPPSHEAVAVDIPYNRFSFSVDGAIAPSVTVTFAADNGEDVHVNHTGYTISSSQEEVDKLFQDLKAGEKIATASFAK